MTGRGARPATCVGTATQRRNLLRAIERGLEHRAFLLERRARNIRSQAEKLRAEREAGDQVSVDVLVKTLELAEPSLARVISVAAPLVARLVRELIGVARETPKRDAIETIRGRRDRVQRPHAPASKPGPLPSEVAEQLARSDAALAEVKGRRAADSVMAEAVAIVRVARDRWGR